MEPIGSVIGGVEGVEVGLHSAASAAASSAHFARIACRWEESVGAAEFEVSISFPDAVNTILGRCADRLAFVAIKVMTAVTARSLGQDFPFQDVLMVAEELYRSMMDRKKLTYKHMTRQFYNT